MLLFVGGKTSILQSDVTPFCVLLLLSVYNLCASTLDFYG